MSHCSCASANWRIETRLACCPNDIAMVMAVRAASFLAEETITYADEFGPNDHVATHILVFVDGDPAGVIRIRWFSGFAVIDRLGVRRRYRTFRVFAALARKAVNHVRAKGYSTLTGKARGDTHTLWRRIIDAKESGPAIHMHRGILIPMIARLTPDECSFANLTLGQPEVEDLIGQPEGAWDFTHLIEERGAVA